MAEITHGKQDAYPTAFLPQPSYHVTASGILVHNACADVVVDNTGVGAVGRVGNVAKNNGFQWLNITDWTWKKNYDWLRHAIGNAKAGKAKNYDIGWARGVTKAIKEGTGGYAKEIRMLERNGFTRVFRRWVTGENGQEFRLYEWVQ